MNITKFIAKFITKILSLSVMSLAIASCSSGGGGSRRLLVEHDPCKEDNKDLTKLDETKRQNAYDLFTPIANLDRAFKLAPKKDNQKVKTPEAQSKIVTDLRDMCLIQTEALGSDYDYQSFNEQKSVSSGKAENVICPVQLDQKVTPNKTLPALVDTVTKEVKSHLELAWKKSNPDYKDLGAILAVEMKGEAKTEWLKSISNQVNVGEKYALKVEAANKEPLVGEYKVCKKHYTIRNAKYEMTVTRIDLTIDTTPIQGKYLTFTKSLENPNTKEWEVVRELRNDFYLNNVLVTAPEIAGLEKKRKATAGL